MPLEFGDDIFELRDLAVSYDQGKILRFSQLGVESYGSPKYHLEDTVILNLNLGFGEETFFRGRVKRITHNGDNNNESIDYEVWGMPNLADEVDVLGIYGDGYYVDDYRMPSTISMQGNVIAGMLAEPKSLINAVSGFFDVMRATLEVHGIPANVDVSTIDKTVVVDASKLLSGGFFNALKDLVAIDPGVKVWYDDTQEIWRFVRATEATVLDIQVADSYLSAHNWEEDSTDRYTAVYLASGGGGSPVNLPAITFDLVPAWDPSLEATWVANSANSTNTNSTGTLTDQEKVYREWALTQPLGAVRIGTKAQLVYRLPGLDSIGQPRWGTVDAEIVAPTYTGSFTQLSILGVPLAGGGTVAQPHAVIRTKQPVVIAGNPFAAGDALCAALGTVGARYFIPVPVFDSTFIRYPAGGFSGEVYEKYGIRKEKILNVAEHEVTMENAKAMHKLYSDIRVTCSLPIYGDPIRDLLRFMEGRVRLSDINGITGLENSSALVMSYSYDFVESVGTIVISNDQANFIENIGK